MISDPAITLACFALPLLLAYVAMELFVFPADENHRRQTQIFSALNRSLMESEGLRKTLEGSEARIRDLLARSGGIEDGLRQHIQRMPPRDQAALQALVTDGSFSTLMEVLRRGLLFDRRVADLKKSWRPGQNTSERDATRLLLDNLWVLEPDLVSEGHLFFGQTLGVAADAYFGSNPGTDDLSQMAARKKPSALGVFRRRSMAANDRETGERVLVIVEARRPGETAGRQTIDAATNYANAMRRLVPQLREWSIESWVIAGAVSEDARVAAMTPPPGTVVHVTTWESLLDRARLRRPETVEFKTIRLDSDNPPSYRPAPRPEGLKAILERDVEPETEQNYSDSSTAEPARASVA